MVLWVTVLAVLALAFANGANDNFKGVATLFGSGTTTYRTAVVWATLTTGVGSITAVILAQQLLTRFSGKGLVDAELAANLRYVGAVALGAGLTVLLATRFGLPVSTTHGLIGGLVGAGWAAGSPIHLARLGGEFFTPLLVSPVAALAVTCLLYPLLSGIRRRSGVIRQSCLCVEGRIVEVVTADGGALLMQRVQQLSVSLGTTVACESRYHGRLVGLDAGQVLDWLHFLSAGAVSFARGLNDTPKIAALLLLIPAMGNGLGVACVAIVMAFGGLLNARRIAETMSRKITPMNHGQGLTANLVTSLIVIGASRFGMPVSTTHVSCGALFGIGMTTRSGRLDTVARILTAWVTTLPLSMALSAVGFWLLPAQ